MATARLLKARYAMDALRLPVSHFSSDDFDGPDQFAGWRESHRLMFDMKALDEREPSVFPASATTYQIGSLLFGRAAYAACRFERDKRRAAEGLDVVMIRLNLEGEHRGVADDLPILARAGEIDIIDLTRTVSYESTGSSVLVLGVPGRILETVLPDRAALHGFVAPAASGMGAILADYLRSLYARASEMTVSEAAGVASATINLTSTCLKHLIGRTPRSRDGSGDLLVTIKDYIEKHIRSDSLNVESLCAAFGLSRATLYRLFAPLGGVARYVRDRRLVAAFVALADRARLHEPVSSIAFELKFASEAHFGRVFRAAFGCTPGQVRTLDAAIDAMHPAMEERRAKAPAYIDWLQRLALRDR